jgi:hypothetical protein
MPLNKLVVTFIYFASPVPTQTLPEVLDSRVYSQFQHFRSYIFLACHKSLLLVVLYNILSTQF